MICYNETFCFSFRITIKKQTIMGRSVNYLNRATKVTYIHNEVGYTDEETNEWIEDEFWFDDLFGNVKYGLKAIFPSLTECERWDNRETKIFLENNLVEIGISEYCGLVSISVRPNERIDANENLANNWIENVWDKAENKMAEFSTLLNRVGTFSNGEGVFEKKS
jgi:hypothetical protein